MINVIKFSERSFFEELKNNYAIKRVQITARTGNDKTMTSVLPSIYRPNSIIKKKKKETIMNI